MIVASGIAAMLAGGASHTPVAAPPTISLPTAAVDRVEGNAGTATATLTASLSSVAASEVTVKYATVDATATVADNDYQPVSGVLTIPAGSTTGTIAVRVVGDTTAEDYQTFAVKLSNPVGATLGNAREPVQILNDDAPSLIMPVVKVGEGGTAVFAPKLAQRYYQPISVNAATSNGSAVAPGDYTSVATSFTFPAASKTPINVNVPTIADGITEPAETFSLTVSGTGVAAPITKTATIANQICVAGASPATYSHVVVVVMENEFGYKLTNNPAAPWFNGVIKSCATATKYSQAASPSRPNYIAMTAGDIFGCAGSNGGPPSGCVPTSESVFKEVLDSGGTVRSYAESMPTNCKTRSVGLYAVKHNPWPYFTAETALCNQWNQPLPDPIDTADLPTFMYIVPNLCNDTHDCDTATGDAWLAQHIQPILESPTYQSGNTAVLITYDEYTNLPNAFASRSVNPGTKVTAPTSHYGLLATIDDLLGLPPLANAATATSLRAATHL